MTRDQVILLSEGVTKNVVPPNSENGFSFFSLLSVKNFELETDDLNDAM